MSQSPCNPAIHTREVVAVIFNGSVKRFSAGKMPAAHKTLVLEMSEVSVHGGQAHCAWPVLESAMKLLSAHFISAATKFLEKALLSVSVRC